MLVGEWRKNWWPLYKYAQGQFARIFLTIGTTRNSDVIDGMFWRLLASNPEATTYIKVTAPTFNSPLAFSSHIIIIIT